MNLKTKWNITQKFSKMQTNKLPLFNRYMYELHIVLLFHNVKYFVDELV